MRACVVLLALLALPAGAGCDAVPPAGQIVPAPPSPVVAPEALVKRLEAMQPAWPREPDCGQAKCVALTFDDGPGDHTGKLLDMLREKGAKATFFVVGQMVAAAHGAATVRRIVAEGHELGNHSWSHPMLTGLSGQRLAYEIGHTGDLVRRLTGVRMRVMRPPYGATDRAVAEQTRRRGLAQILWNVDTFDWRDRVPALVAKRGAQVRPGSIVLMHDIHPTTVKAVPRLLDTLGHRGYSFVTVTELYGDRLRPGRRYEQLRRR